MNAAMKVALTVYEDTKKVLSCRNYKAGYRVIEAVIGGERHGGTDTTLKFAVNHDGQYIGDPKTAHYLCKKRGIKPELSSPDHKTCSIGFCETEQKWYGWSHRARYGFGIGSTCEKGDCGYRPATPQEIFDEMTTPDDDGWAWQKPENVELLSNGVRVTVGTVKVVGENDDGSLITAPAEDDHFEVECGRGEWTANTLEDAKQMAIDFANGVS